MPTVPATGQFGPNVFQVTSLKGTIVDAKYLTDSIGANYIIDPNTAKPYVVPLNYDPAATAAYFTNKLNLALGSVDSGSAALSTTNIMFQELKSAFTQGQWGDIQRPLPLR